MSPSSEPHTFALGPTVGAALSHALPGLLRTGWTSIPLTIASTVFTALIVGTTLTYVVVVLTVVTTVPTTTLAIAHSVYTLLALLTVPILPLLLAPFFTAMAQSHWTHLRDDVDLGVMDGIRGAFSNLPLLFWVGVYLVCTVLGYLCLIIPGLLFEAAFGFVMPAMIVHKLSLGQAIRRSLRHFIDAPMWHLGLTLIDQLLAVAFGSLIPVIGPGLGTSFSLHVTLRAYVEAYPAAAALIEPTE